MKNIKKIPFLFLLLIWILMKIGGFVQRPVFFLIHSLIELLMEQPILYKFVQSTLAGAGHDVIKKFLKSQIPKNAKNILDQGCGTGEYSLLFGSKYTGLDNSAKDIEFAQKRYKGKFITESAANMKSLKNNYFDIVFAVGLHHHLSGDDAKKAILESIRVCKNRGKVIIIDAMLPRNPMNVIGFLLRKLDRGGHVRKVEDTLKLLPKNLSFSHQILSSFPFDYIVIIF